MWLGAALATTNWITLVIALVAMFGAYHYRIQSEEHMLVTAMGDEYRQYRQHTWKLMPFVY